MTENRKRELLQQYIQGSITAKNRHALEREALDDVFLFEALEGYSNHMTSTDLPFYKSKKNTVLPIRTYLTMAASFLMIAAVAFLIKQNVNPTINRDAIVQMEEEPSVSSDQFATIDEAKTDLQSGLDQEDITVSVSKKTNTLTEENEKIASQSTTSTIAKTETNIESTINKPREDDRTTKQQVSDVFSSAPSTEVGDEDQANHKTLADSNTNNETRPSQTKDIVENNQAARYPASRVSTQSKNSQSSPQTIPARPTTAESIESKSEDPKIAVEINEEKEEISDDSLERQHNRKSYPVGGWTLFNEKLDSLSKHISCEGFSFTFKFKILSDGNIDNLKVIDLPSVDKDGPSSVLECLNKTKGFMEDLGKWETMPMNRQINRILTIDY